MGAEPTQPLERIILTGFMGSGKTTVGKLLAARLSWTFVDLDDEISHRAGLAVPEIFSRHGEAVFRREETASLTSCLQRTQIVLALGGGVPEVEANRHLLRSSDGTIVIYLEGAFETLQTRCTEQALQRDSVARPNFVDSALARQRFKSRAPLYRGISTHTLSTDGRTPRALAEAIQSLLGLADRTP